MSQPRLQTVVQHLRKMVNVEERASDAELLARYVSRRDEAAFTTLVQRHGPMILGVCRRMLRKPADAEDAWQATFLVLARKATAIKKQASVAAWLHGVALRICQRTREKVQREKHGELPVELLQAKNDDLSWREVQRILDEEIERLPERLRQPIVLCYLEGRTRDEAAAELGWTLSTFRGRLDMARERLRKSLIKRGLTLPAALLATLLSQAGEASAIPQALMESLLPAAISGSTSATLLPLVEGGIQAMSASKMPAVVSMFFAASLIIGSGVYFGQKPTAAAPNSLAAAEPSTDRAKDESKKDGDKRADLPDAIKRKVLASDRILILRPGKSTDSLKGPNGSLQISSLKDMDDRPLLKDNRMNCILFLRSIEEGSASPRIYPIDPKGWYVQHTPELERAIRAAIPLPETWGETKNGLRMGLLPRHTSYKPGEDIAIDIAVQNTSDKDVNFKQLRYNIYDYWLLTFLVETPTGQTLILSKPASVFNEEDIPTTRVLKPGETYVHTVRLNRWLNPDEQVKDHFAAAGNYSVAVNYYERKGGERVPKDYLVSSKVSFEVLPMDYEAARLEDVTAHLDRLQVNIQLAPVDPKGVANPPYPLRYIYLNVLPIPIEPHGKWPNGTPIGADARITKEQAGKIVAALHKLGFLKEASSAIPEFRRNGPYAAITLRYRPDGAMENKQLWLPLDWDLKMIRHLQAIRGSLDGAAAKHLDAMLASLEADRKKWEADGLSLDKMQGKWRLVESEWKGRAWPLADGMSGTLNIKSTSKAIPYYEENLKIEIAANSSASVIAAAKANLARVIAEDGQISISLIAGKNTKGIFDGEWQFNGKVVFEAPPEQPLYLNDRADLAEGRWIILRGRWTTNGSDGTQRDEPVWYHPTKQLLRIAIPGQQAAYLVFQRDDVDWGQESQGLSIRARAVKAQLNAGEQPTFEIDLRNRSTKAWSVTAVPPLVQIEVDGKWYNFDGDLDFKAAIRNLKPDEQIDKWISVAPDKTWGHGGDTDEPRKALEWKAGKHKVRLAYSIQGKFTLHSQAFAIEIAEPKETGWGEAVEGLQLRGRPTKAVWNIGEQPTFEVDLRNRGSKEWEIRAVSLLTKVEIGGVWHRLGGIANVPSQIEQLKAEEQRIKWFTVAPNKSWIRNLTPETSAPLEWKPGKHKVRLGYAIKDKVEPITAVIEIEIVDPKETGWGKAVNDFQLRVRPDKSSFTTSEVPSFKLDVRSRSQSVTTAGRVPQYAQIEVDGMWYFALLPGDLLSGKINAGEEVDTWVSIGLTPGAWRRSEQDWIGPAPLTLSAGKHTLRVAYPIGDRALEEALKHYAENVKIEIQARSSQIAINAAREGFARAIFKQLSKNALPISAPIEFEIVDPKNLGWGQPDNGVSTRLKVQKKIWSIEETPVLDIGVRNQSTTALSVADPPVCRVEVDGETYVNIEKKGTANDSIKLPAGTTQEDFIRIELSSKWIWQSPLAIYRPLKLTPGKHIIRVICQIDRFKPVSNAIEIEVVDPKQVGWGKVEGGLQLRGRSTKATWMLGEKPEFILGLRSRGASHENAPLNPMATQIEVDGTWYETIDAGFYLAFVRYDLKANEQLDNWLSVTIDDRWCCEKDKKRVLLEWKPGKHTVRLAYPFTDKCRPITESFEITILDSKDLGWGEAIGGVQLRARMQPFKYADQDTFKFELDLRNQSTKDIRTQRLQEKTELEVDGVWYQLPHAWNFYFPKEPIDVTLKAGTSCSAFTSVVLHSHWYRKLAPNELRRDNPGKLELKPGKHKIRLAYEVQPNVRPVTEPIEIEIVDAKK